MVTGYKLTKREIAKQSRSARPKGCPTRDLCMPLAVAIGGNGAGTCVGLIIHPPDLDCIKYCKFIWKGEDGGRDKVEMHEFCATPLEAMDFALGLFEAVYGLFHYSEEYRRKHKELEKIRKGGNFNYEGLMSGKA